MATRTFFALDIDEALRRELAGVAGGIDCGDARIHWVRPENLHVTMAFLGDVSDEVLRDVCGVAAETAGGIEPFDFAVPGLSCVPPRGPVRMVWADATDPTGRMAALHDELGSRLGGLGFPPEQRRFRGHITLGRVKRARGPSAGRIRGSVGALAILAGPDQHATELVAYGSRLTPDGPVYTPIVRARLGG